MMEKLSVALQAAADKKAEDPVALDLRSLSSFTDGFLICNGRNQRHVQAIASNIEEAMKKRKFRPRHIEGFRHGEWVLLDFFDLVVHVFTPERRELLQLERLWSDAPRLESGMESVESEKIDPVDNLGNPN